MTGRHRRPKRKLPAGYREPSLQQTSQRATVVIIECGIVQFFCAMLVFKGRASSSSPGLPLCQILFLSIAELAHGEKSRTVSLNHPAYSMPGDACASEGTFSGVNLCFVNEVAASAFVHC